MYVHDGAAGAATCASPGRQRDDAQQHPGRRQHLRVGAARTPSHSNDIAFIGIGNDEPTNNSSVITAAIWNGNTNTFGSKVIHSWPNTGPDGSTPQNPHFTDAADIDFVLAGANLGEAVAVWGTQSQVWSNVWNPSTGWAGNVSVSPAGSAVRWIRQKARPRGDDLLIMVLSTAGILRTIAYDGDTRTFGPGVLPTGFTGIFRKRRLPSPGRLRLGPGQRRGRPPPRLLRRDGHSVPPFERRGRHLGWAADADHRVPGLLGAARARPQRHRAPARPRPERRPAGAGTGTASSWTSTPAAPPHLHQPRAGRQPRRRALRDGHLPAAGRTERATAAADPTTAVELDVVRGVAPGFGGRARLADRSELDNLGFHVHRSLSENGPWTRVTPSLIPGLGSSPEGASYSWTDTGLLNGTRYFYRLEDVDSASVSTFHGPVSVVPQRAVADGRPTSRAPCPVTPGERARAR